MSQHYQEDADGLCTCLGAPLPREGSTTSHIDKSAFEQAGKIILKESINDLVLGGLDDQEGGVDVAREDREGRVWGCQARSI